MFSPFPPNPFVASNLLIIVVVHVSLENDRFSLFIIPIAQFQTRTSDWSSMKAASQTNINYSQPVDNRRDCQTFVYNADEVSLEALLNPNFRPMVTPKRRPSSRQLHYENYVAPQRSSSNSTQQARFERASFDPLRDLPAVQAFSTIPTRRRQHHALNYSSIVHL